MNSVTTCICFRSVLMVNGLTHFIRFFAPESQIQIIPEISELLKTSDLKGSVLFLDTRLFSTDPVLSLEKIKKIVGSGQLIGFYDKKLPDRILPYFDDVIDVEAGDEEIRSLFEKVYNFLITEKNNFIDNNLISDREIEILKFVALGYTNNKIADQLRISAHTVITHRKNITSKLGIKTIAGLTVYAILNSIIKAEEVG